MVGLVGLDRKSLVSSLTDAEKQRNNGNASKPVTSAECRLQSSPAARVLVQGSKVPFVSPAEIGASLVSVIGSIEVALDALQWLWWWGTAYFYICPKNKEAEN